MMKQDPQHTHSRACHSSFPPRSTASSLAWWLRRPPRERKIRSLNSACDGIFLDRVIPVTSKISTSVATPQGTWRYRVRLGLVGPVSVYCDWVKWKVSSATCISVWQHVQLSEQISPWDTLACCWDVKQPTNNQTNPRFQSLTHTLPPSPVPLRNAAPHTPWLSGTVLWCETDQVTLKATGSTFSAFPSPSQR